MRQKSILKLKGSGILKRVIAIIAALTILMISALQTSAQGAQGWYCVRNDKHLQPIADSNLSYVEKYDGFYIDKAHGDNCDEKVVYLTFDAGYENGNVERILNTLKEKDVKGAFFILGNLITKNTELVIRMSDEGHTVANHTVNHPDMTTKKSKEAFAEELFALEALYKEYTGRTMSKFFRPPEGRFSEATMKYAQELGYYTIFWSFAYADWDNNKQMSAAAAKKKIMDNIHNGAVILLHPTSKTNADILGDVIDELKADGYRFGTLDELVGIK